MFSYFSTKLRNLSAAKFIYATLMWSKAFIPVLAILAAIASSIRTVQATGEIYAAAGSAPWAVWIAAGAFTFSVEGALFMVALAQENQRLRWRAARKKRHVMSLRTIGRAIAVRLGREEPLSYDQIPDSDGGLNTLITIAFSFAIASNLYLGLKPLTDQMGSTSLQGFLVRILNADAHLQLSFILDLAGVFFPPFMALKAGHLTARFASEVMASQARSAVKGALDVKPKTEQPESRSKLNASERVAEHLTKHPEDGNLSQRKLAKKLDVSVGTINHVVNAPASSNGNAHGSDER